MLSPLALPDEPEPVLEPGHDVERGPRGYGETFRELTPLTDAELSSIHPRFRHLAHLFKDGQADKRVMRIYSFSRSRLDPFDRPLPPDGRKKANDVLRDRERTRAGIDAFRLRGPRHETGAVTPPSGAIEGAAARLRDAGAGVNGGPLESLGVSVSGVWVPVGPFVIPGRMTGLARPGNAADTLYVTAADGGLWVTRDAGQTWTPLSDFEPTL